MAQLHMQLSQSVTIHYHGQSATRSIRALKLTYEQML
jgi:hypothetical protein